VQQLRLVSPVSVVSSDGLWVLEVPAVSVAELPPVTEFVPVPTGEAGGRPTAAEPESGAFVRVGAWLTGAELCSTARLRVPRSCSAADPAVFADAPPVLAVAAVFAELVPVSTSLSMPLSMPLNISASAENSSDSSETIEEPPEPP
jgi:hypothetical protein